LAASATAQDLTALVEARARLEVALAADESWRALHRSAGQAEESAARRARNTRLKMALAENPLYQAWKHLGEAIAALEATRTGSDAAAAGPAREADGEAVSQGASGSLARRLEVMHPGASVREPGPAAPQAAAEPHAVPPPAYQRARDDAEPDEATVTIVRREPLLPSLEQPPDLGSGRGRGLSERLRALTVEPQPVQEERFSAPGAAEEAEVVIVASEGAEAQPDARAAGRAGRRVRKTKPGD
jgi:hypothetical protein